MAKIDLYYQEELFRLQTLASEYARANPSQAGHLVGAGSDPDVERILEGVAFLTAGLKAELEKDQDQLLHNLLQVASPELLRPLPATTVLRFMPRNALKNEMVLLTGTPVSGINNNGKRCEFRTLQPVTLWPLEISNVAFDKSRDYEPGVYKFTISLTCTQGSLGQLAGKQLPLYLSGQHGMISKLMGSLLHHLDVFSAQAGERELDLVCPELNTEFMHWPLTADDIPELPGARLLQRYFLSSELGSVDAEATG